MQENQNKKKNRYRDRKKNEFTFGKGIKKKKMEKIIIPKESITGIYSQMVGKPFGFVDVEGEESGFFVIDRNRKGAFDGDEVVAELKMYNGKQEAVILEVLKRRERNIVGVFQYSKRKSQSGDEFGFVVPKKGGFSTDIFIAGQNIGKARNGDIVGVEIVNYQGKNPSGKIIDVLGKKGESVDVDGYIMEAGFSQKFEEPVIKELTKNTNLSQQGGSMKDEKKKRKDFRDMFTFTIDGEDAKDLDDAISIKKKDNGSYLLYIHIADVSHYIREDSKLDKEALKRSTSVYLADRVIPMLPEELSNHLCSLNTESEKLTLTCEVLLSKNGELVKTTMYESIINSNFRLTYKEVDELIDGKIRKGDDLFGGNKCTENLLNNIHIAEELKQKITAQKEKTGVLNFDFPETKLILDENKKVTEIKRYPRYRSNKMIEEFMVMANEAVSRKFGQYPFLYRIHEAPLEESREKLIVLLNLFNIGFKFDKFDTKEVGKLLEIINNKDQEGVEGIRMLNGKTILTDGQKKFLEKSILRTLSKAVYSDENCGHFGLGLQFYSHFTSPIRRYPDLQIHRIIKEKLQGKLDTTRVEHYKNILKPVATRTSEQERKAEKLEYKIRDFYICEFYKEKLGQEFEGVITTMLPYGFFVQLEDTTEGFVELIPKNAKSLGYTYDEKLMRFTNESLAKVFNLGDVLQVSLVEVDMELLRINFTLQK